MIKYLHLDCEMGGRDLKYSLLTAYFLVTDDKFNTLGDLYLQVKPDDGDYIVNGKGMTVNQINLQEHDAVAIEYKPAKKILFNFLLKHTQPVSGESLLVCPKLTPVGHGVKGDIEHLQDKLISVGSWEQFCTYHYIDTSVVLQFLRSCGKMPHDVDGSISALAKYFGIETDVNATRYGFVQETGVVPWHNAKFDTEMTMKVYQKMVELGKK